MQKRTALLSVWDKAGIVEFARNLAGLGFDILGSRGTVAALIEKGIPSIDIATIVGPPILGHRVVTLSREIHAGLLATDTTKDREELNRLSIPWIDLACVNFYPLGSEVNNPGATRESVIEATDIGGPTMIRSAAKGRRITVTSAELYPLIIRWLEAGEPQKETVLDLMTAAAEYLVANYCLTSSCYHAGVDRYIMNANAGQKASLPPDTLLRALLENLT
ncbi:MAG: hypothetical protein ACM3KM_02730 [Acidobacteriaceae bacterium]